MRFGAGAEGRVEAGARVTLCEFKTTPHSMVQLASRIYSFEIFYIYVLCFWFWGWNPGLHTCTLPLRYSLISKPRVSLGLNWFEVELGAGPIINLGLR